MAKLANFRDISRWVLAAWEVKFQAAPLCKALETSERQVCRYAHTLFDTSTQEWLNYLRMALAPDTLKKRRSVKATAIELGFKHQGHFTDMFKRYYGVCPTVYLDFSVKHEQDMRRYRQQRD